MTATTRPLMGPLFRRLAVLGVAALTLSLLPLGGALAQEEVDDPDDACPEEPPPHPYTDRDEIPEVHLRNVDCVTHRNIAMGFPDGTYRPFVNVPRNQMASFIARTLDEAGADLPDADEHPGFEDTEGDFHEDNIRRLAAAGIVEGGPEELPATHYGPFREVRRDQMGSFLIRAAEFAFDEEFGSDEQQFEDVTSANVHFETVNAAAEFGLAQGGPQELPETMYGPGRATWRAHMASFLARLLAFVEGEPPLPPPPTPPVTPPITPPVTPPVTPDAGFTLAPELIAAEHAETTGDGDVDVRFVFDLPVSGEAADIAPSEFHLHTGDGQNIRGDSAEADQDDSNAVVVRFDDAEGDLDDVTVAAVDHGAVVGVDTEGDPTEPNPEGSVVFPEENGATEAPVLEEVVVGEEDNGEREIVFSFDTSLDGTQTIDPGDFALYDEDGARTELTDCDYGAQIGEVACTVTAPLLPLPIDPEWEAAETAVLGGVASEVLAPDTPPAGTDPRNHADSEPVTT